MNDTINKLAAIGAELRLLSMIGNDKKIESDLIAMVTQRLADELSLAINELSDTKSA